MARWITKETAIAALLGLALVGCTTRESAEGDGAIVTFACESGETIQAAFSATPGGEVELVLPEQEVSLPQVEAASGAKYSDGTVTFWEKGGEALVEVDGEVVLQSCVSE